MNPLTFPAASYGRNGESPPQAVDQYQVLFQSAAFPAKARTALEELVASVQWAGGGSADNYEDCFALWPLARSPEGALVARLMDAGRDRLGRPHALRVDAVYVEASELTTSPARLASVLSVAAWPGKPWTGDTQGITLNIGDVAGPVAAALEQALATSGLPRAFVARHAHFRAQGFDLVFDPDAPAGRAWASPVATKPPSPAEKVAGGATATPSAPSHPLSWLVAMVMILGCFVATGWWSHDRYRKLQGSYDGLRQQLNDVQGKFEDESSARRQTTASLGDLQRTLHLAQDEIARLKSENAEANEAKAELGKFNLTMTDLPAILQRIHKLPDRRKNEVLGKPSKSNEVNPNVE